MRRTRNALFATNLLLAFSIQLMRYAKGLLPRVNNGCSDVCRALWFVTYWNEYFVFLFLLLLAFERGSFVISLSFSWKIVNCLGKFSLNRDLTEGK